MKKVMMMRRQTRYGGTKPSHPYDGVILKLKKSSARQQMMTVYTRQEGILNVFVDRSRQSRQGYGSLMILGEITFDAVEKNGAYQLTEYECRSNGAVRKLTWQVYVYTQIFLEMVLHIMAPHQADEEVYRLLVIYGRAIEIKDPRIVTIIAGWQLISQAGFYPDVDHVHLYADSTDNRRQPAWFLSDAAEAGRREITVSESVRKLWKTILQYPWGQAATLHISPHDIDIVEQILYSYFCQCSEKELKSIMLL